MAGSHFSSKHPSPQRLPLHSRLTARIRAATVLFVAVSILTGCVAVGPPVRIDSHKESTSSSQKSSSPVESPRVSAESPDEESPEKAALTAALRSGHSSYGRSTLSAEMQTAYDQLVEGILGHRSDISVSLGTEAALSQTLLCVRRDYPLISWMESQYSYQMNANRIIQGVTLQYSKNAETIATETQAIYEAGQELTANIDKGLSDFDKALILYDRLCEAVEYNLNAPNQRELYGALVDRSATCDGYSKAYQYLLGLVGIEALIVYGIAEEPHAWNIVKLNGSYYAVDPTWGDASVSDGTVFLSHEFAFLDDANSSRSHVPYGNEHNYTLPACDSMQQNYFVQKGTQLSASEEMALAECLQNALNLALANNYDAVQIRFETQEISRDCLSRWVDSGDADRMIQQMTSQRDKKAIGRSISNYGDVLTYLIQSSS